VGVCPHDIFEDLPFAPKVGRKTTFRNPHDIGSRMASEVEFQRGLRGPSHTESLMRTCSLAAASASTHARPAIELAYARFGTGKLQPG
jgi:hypothetical protein